MPEIVALKIIKRTEPLDLLGTPYTHYAEAHESLADVRTTLVSAGIMDENDWFSLDGRAITKPSESKVKCGAALTVRLFVRSKYTGSLTWSTG